MKKRLFYLALPVITLILELLPYGAVCNFAVGPDETVRKTFSYFDLVPFGYANFSPLLTAIITCAAIVLLVIYLFKINSRIIEIARLLLCIGTVLSLCPLLLGINYFSAVGVLISVSLIAESVLLFFTVKKSNQA